MSQLEILPLNSLLPRMNMNRYMSAIPAPSEAQTSSAANAALRISPDGIKVEFRGVKQASQGVAIGAECPGIDGLRRHQSHELVTRYELKCRALLNVLGKLLNGRGVIL